eukprot:SAG25_NODE_449_length_7908_cov_17.677039_5_plen_455_part_00
MRAISTSYGALLQRYAAVFLFDLPEESDYPGTVGNQYRLHDFGASRDVHHRFQVGPYQDHGSLFVVERRDTIQDKCIAALQCLHRYLARCSVHWYNGPASAALCRHVMNHNDVTLSDPFTAVTASSYHSDSSMVHHNSISCGQALGTDDHTTLFRFDTPPNGEESPTASNLTGMWFDMHELLKFYRRQGQMYIDRTATSERASAAEAVREALVSIITHAQSGPYAHAFSALKTAVVTAWMSLDDQDFAFGIAYADPDSSTWTERLLPRQQLVWESHKWESYNPETMAPDTDDKMGGNIRLYSTTTSALGLLCPSFKSQFGRLRVFPDNYSTDYVHSDTMLQELQDDTRDGNYQAALTDQVESRLLDGSPGPLLQVVRCRTGTPEICDNLWGHKHHMPATEDSMPFVGVVLTCDDRIGLLATSAGSPVDHWHVSMDVVKSGISPWNSLSSVSTNP